MFFFDLLFKINKHFFFVPLFLFFSNSFIFGQNSKFGSEISELSIEDIETFDRKIIFEVCTYILENRDKFKKEVIVKALNTRGITHYYCKDHSKAIKDFDDLLVVDPKNDLAFCQKGKVFLEIGKLEDADSNFKEAIRLNQNSSENHLFYGFFLMSKWEKTKEKEQKNQALESINNAIVLDPKYGLTYYYRGCYYNYVENDPVKSLSDINIFIDFSPHLIPKFKKNTPYFLRGMAYLTLNRPKEALSNFLFDIKINTNSGSIMGTGRAYYELGAYYLAAHYFEKAVALEPLETYSHGWLAATYAKIGKWKEAQEAARKTEKLKGIKIQPTFRELGDVQFFVGNYDKALEYYDKQLALNPTDYSGLVNKATLLATCPDPKFRNGQLAVDLARKALGFPNVPVHFRWMAAIALADGFAEAGDFDAAIHFVNGAINFAGPDCGYQRFFREKLDLYQRKIPYREKSPPKNEKEK